MLKTAQTPAPQLLPLPYHSDSAAYFHTIHGHLPMAVLLQSDAAAQHANRRGRFDILSAAPEYWLASSNGITTLHGNVPPALQRHALNVPHISFGHLHAVLEQMAANTVDYSHCLQAELPFCGGLMGYCSYDLARDYIPLASRATADIHIPDMQFGFYSWACIQDHQQQKSWLLIHPDCNPTLQQQLPALLQSAAQQNQSPVCDDVAHSDATRFSSNITYTHYQEKFAQIQRYIQAGDCYQINIAQRFQSPCAAAGIRIYEQLRAIMPSPFCAYLPILGTDDVIISLSPERFLQMSPNREVITQPIKGTASRYADAEADQQAATALQHDEKNRAENLMIVDLLRNDLGKVCETGSVQTEKLFELQSFANVHHLVSTIRGKLKGTLNGADLLQACFPGGSITGAPKIRAMQIIEELEPARRSIYCGSIAYFSAHGAMDSNITIRTLLLHEQQLYCWGGGGIVADSDGESEYQESIAKIKTLLAALSKPGWQP